MQSASFRLYSAGGSDRIPEETGSEKKEARRNAVFVPGPPPGPALYGTARAGFAPRFALLFGKDVKIRVNRKIFSLFFLAVLAARPGVCVSSPNKAEITNIELDKTGRNLEVSFRLKDCFNSDMEEAILGGVPTTFRIIVSVEKPSSLLFVRSKIADFSLLHTIRYNRLNNEFQVDLPEHPQKILVTRSFDEAKKWMSAVDNLPIIPTCWLKKDQEYYLYIKAELSKVELPLFFRYILFWVSLWDFETEWYTVQFLY